MAESGMRSWRVIVKLAWVIKRPSFHPSNPLSPPSFSRRNLAPIVAMHSLATFFVSITLLASQTWAASINAHPAKAARWLHVPRTLQDPDQFKRSNLDAREYAGFSPLEKKELFARQGCDPATQTTCAGGNQCCPGADACYTYNGNQVGCCPIPNICTGEFQTLLSLYFLIHASVCRRSSHGMCRCQLRRMSRQYWRLLPDRSSLLSRYYGHRAM